MLSSFETMKYMTDASAYREGDCEILAPLLPQGSLSPARNGNCTERKRRRESDMMSPPGTNKRLR